ncbi:hypothetical protein V3G39_00540 [Dermatophilaceae bacterium Sec6.4]
MSTALVTATEDVRAKTISPEVYATRIAERDRYGLHAKEKPRPGIAERVGCPASGANPTAKCLLKFRSEESRPTTTINGQRVDLRPRITPSDDLQQHPPKVCRQGTITIQPSDGAKYRQTLPYASPEHSRVYYLLRETQEGFHGFSKDEAREALGAPSRRRSRGVPANSIVASILLASAGIRKVRTFLEEAEPDDNGVLSIPRPPRSPKTGPPGAEPARDI